MKSVVFKQHIISSVVAVCLFLFSFTSSFSQEVNIQYTYRHYTINDGLAQMQIMGLHQDSQGYLWCVTKAGISRFNGHSFDNFYGEITNRKSYLLPEFGEDMKGNFIIFDHEYFYHFENNNFKKYDYLNKKYRISPSLHQPSKSKLLEVINNQTNELELLNYTNLNNLTVTKLKHPIIHYDQFENNTIWQADKDSIFVNNLSNNKVVAKYPNPNSITKILQTAKTTFAYNNKSEIFELKNNSFIKIIETGLDFKDFKAIPTPKGDAFIIKTDADLYYYKDSLKPIKKNMAYIREILFDKEDNLWVATEEGLYNFFQLNFVNYTFGMGNKDWVWSVIEDNDQNMWFASYLNGLWKWDGEKVTDYTNHLNSKLKSHIRTSPPTNAFRYYMGTSKNDNELYFPTESNVIAFNGQQFYNVPNLPYTPYQTTKTYENGTIVFGGVKGLIEKQPNGNQTHWTNTDLNLASVLDVATDTSGNYIAIGSNGFALIKKDSIQHFNQPEFKNRICSTKDHKQNVWMAGRNGFTLFDGKNATVIPKYLNETFYSILFVEPHYILAGGIKGLYVANLEDYYNTGLFEMLLYDSNSGFTGLECGQNGFFTDSEGFVWLPTSDLVCRFNPKTIISKTIEAPKLIPSIEISSNKIDWNPVTKPEKELKHNHNNLKVKLNTISFSNLGKLRYYYKIEGLQDSWSEAHIENEFIFYNLKPGSYTLHFKADAGITKTTSEVGEFKFCIAKPFWLQWWFLVIILILFSLLIWGIIKIQNRKIRKQELIKKRMIQLRSEALRAQMNPHLIHNALNNINGLINLERNNEAQEFLTAFSKMLRLVLRSVNRDTIPLAEELAIIKSFIDFHSHVHQSTINYNIKTPNNISVDSILIPPMLIQPYVENAILHGILPLKDRKGHIEVSIVTENKRLITTIKDNGVGIGNSKYKGTGLGTKFSKERVELLDPKHKNPAKIRNLVQGTEVIINIPLKTM